MAATYKPLKISARNFASIQSRLANGLGLFVDGTYRYAVVDRSAFELRVVRRTGTSTFSGAVAALSPDHRVTINGNYFAGTALYPRAQTGVVNATNVFTIGDVYQNGSRVESDWSADREDPADYFHFGSDRSSPRGYRYGRGNAPTTLQDGMGGLGPMILTNPATGMPIRYGVGNRYASSPGKSNIPQTDAEWRDCVQRNNLTYASIQREAARHDIGFCVIASCSQPNILMAAIKPHKESGDLDTIRDKMFDAGMQGACFTDGSNSACFAVDRSFDFPPAPYKDNLIEYGLSLFETAVDVLVTFTLLEVLDDMSAGGPGNWDLVVQANGVIIGSFARRTVNTGDTIPLGWTQRARALPGGAGTLQIIVSGIHRTAGSAVDLGTARMTFTASSSPAWGVGPRTVTSPHGSYRALLMIAVIR